MTQFRGLRAGAILSLVAITVAGCGSSSKSSSTRGSTSNGSATSGAASSTTPGGSISQAAALFSKYTGGTSGPAATSKSPVVIGFMNNQGGIPSFPEGTVAAQAAVKLINTNLGGINGHPIQLDTCFVASAESQGQSCAQQFLAKKLPIIVESNGAVGGASFHNTINGQIPVIMPNPDSAIEASAKNAYGTNPAVFGTTTGLVAYAAKIHAKTASLLFPGDDPTGQTAAKQFEAQLGKIGVKVTPAGFTSNAPDLLPTVIASGAAHTDMTIALVVNPQACISAAKALKQANVTKPIVGLFLCISPQVKQGLGDYPKWTFVDTATNVEFSTDPATKGYLATMKAYAPAGANVGGNAQYSFSAVLGAARALNRAGGAGVNPAKVSAVLKTDLTGEPMLDPAIRYGVIPGLPDLPNFGARLFTYKGNGQWVDETHGVWASPPSH